MAIYKGPSENFVSTTLNGSINDSVDSITLNDASKLQYPGYIIIDREDGNGTATPTAREVVSYTGISSNTLTGCTRGADSSTARSHSDGALVEAVLTSGMWTSVRDVVASLSSAGTDLSVTATASISTVKAINLGVSSIASVARIEGANMALTSLASITFLEVGTRFNASGASVTGFIMNATSNQIGTSTLLSFNSPRGFLINGKISPTVSSNNLTVAIKGVDGNDPSATNPVYCRIGDTVRSITSALSVTKNAGTNWFNSGGSELATKEQDYFVYLGYNATDGVVIGFSRVPYATEYDDFSATTTNERYCAISTISNAAAGDDYELIGRFAATLSAGAGYTWSVPTYTNKNLIQRPVFETRWLTFSPTLAWTAADSPGTPDTEYYNNKYKIRNSSLILSYYQSWSSAGTSVTQVTFTTPMTGKQNTTSNIYPMYTRLAHINRAPLVASQYSSQDSNKLYTYLSSASIDRYSVAGEYEI